VLFTNTRRLLVTSICVLSSRKKEKARGGKSRAF
jgi:hypothetical protein